MSSDPVWAPAGDQFLPVCPQQRFSGFPNDAEQRGASYMLLSEILTTKFDTDAHYGAYWHPDAPPRINNEGLALIPSGMRMSMFIADVDCEKSHRATGGSEKVPAPDDWYQSELVKIHALEAAHPGVKWDRSRGGYRLVWRLSNQLVVSDESDMTAWSTAYVRWLAYMARAFGIIGDPACKNWNRIFRVPHATRKGNTVPDSYESGGDPLNVGVWTYDEDEHPLAADLATAQALAARYADWNGHGVSLLERASNVGTGARSPRARAPRSPSPAAVAITPARSNEVAQALLQPVLRVADSWHYLFLAIAGALCERGVEGDRVFEIVEALSASAGDTKTPDRVAGARTTAKKFASGGMIAGFGSLRRTWPEVAAALDQQLPAAEDEGIERLRAELTARPTPLSLSTAAAVARIEGAFRDATDAPEPVYVVSATTGAGKTTAARNAIGSSSLRSAIVFPNNALAIEAYGSLDSVRRGEVQRRFGVLSMLDAKEAPVCKLASTALKVQEAGLAVPTVLCPRCEHKATCPAYGGAEGAQHPKVIVANHALLSTVVDEVGPRCMLVVDETPSLFEEAGLTVEDLQTTLQQISIDTFVDSYSRRVRPFVFLFKEALELVRHGDCEDFDEGLRRSAIACAAVAQWAFFWLPVAGEGEPGIDIADPLGAALAVFRAATTDAEPPLSARARGDLSRGVHVAPIGRAATVLRTLAKAYGPNRAHTATLPGERPRAPREAGLSRPDVVLTLPNERVLIAMKRQGPTILLDGTADVEAVRALAAPRPVVEVNVDVADGAPVSRTVLYWRAGARSLMAPHGRADPATFQAALRGAMQRLAQQQCQRILLVSHKPVADVLRETIRSPGSAAPLLIASLAPLTATGARIAVAHFGNVRGRNDFDGIGWHELDAVVTMGDPWPDIGKVANENRLLRLTEDQSSARLRALTGAELAQAHGRIRAPMRTRPAIALHLGQVIPLGWHGQNAWVESRTQGRPPTQNAMSITELTQLRATVGGVRALARKTNIPESTLRAYLQGRAVPAATAERLRATAAAIASASAPSGSTPTIVRTVPRLAQLRPRLRRAS